MCASLPLLFSSLLFSSLLFSSLLFLSLLFLSLLSLCATLEATWDSKPWWWRLVCVGKRRCVNVTQRSFLRSLFCLFVENNSTLLLKSACPRNSACKAHHTTNTTRTQTQTQTHTNTTHTNTHTKTTLESQRCGVVGSLKNPKQNKSEQNDPKTQQQQHTHTHARTHARTHDV